MTSRKSRTPARADTATNSAAAARPTRLDQIIDLLQHKDGASLDALCAATGWQPHSVRGALSGALKKKGHAILSDRTGGVRRYRIGDPQ